MARAIQRGLRSPRCQSALRGKEGGGAGAWEGGGGRPDSRPGRQLRPHRHGSRPIRTGWHFGSPSSYYWAGLWQSPGGPLPPTCRACERQGRANAGVGVGSLPQQHLSHCGVTLPARGGPRMEGSWLVQKCKSSKRLYRSCAQVQATRCQLCTCHLNTRLPWEQQRREAVRAPCAEGARLHRPGALTTLLPADGRQSCIASCILIV